MTNEQLLDDLEMAVEARFKGASCEHAASARAAVLARMAVGEDVQRAAFMAGCKWEREMAATSSDAVSQVPA